MKRSELKKLIIEEMKLIKESADPMTQEELLGDAIDPKDIALFIRTADTIISKMEDKGFEVTDVISFLVEALSDK